MAKDRNTFAKRQREVDRKRKADQKRERRAKRKQAADETCKPTGSPSGLSSAESAVLDVFRRYLMTPGQMLCFVNSDRKAFDEPLNQLASKGLLVTERTEGGYSLTQNGFAAMRDGQ